MSLLDRAILIAVQAHAGQKDKADQPYVFHPLRMMLRLSTMEQRIAAVLHDVVEDTTVTLEDLRREGFPEGVLSAIESVTRRKDETYEAFVMRAAANPIGRAVKLADLEDNSNLSRIKNPTARDHGRVEKYRRAIEMLHASQSKNEE